MEAGAETAKVVFYAGLAAAYNYPALAMTYLKVIGDIVPLLHVFMVNV